MNGKRFGVYRASVVGNSDPENRSRLQVFLTAFGATQLWAEACVPSMPCVIPRVGDTVWILFEEGQPELPVWIGVLPRQAG